MDLAEMEAAMKLKRHGLAIGMERIDGDFFMTLKVIGKLTHADYEQIMPVIDAALSGITQPKVRVFFDADEFDGWELRAAWDDLRLGLKHGNRFSRVAVYGHGRWREYMSRIGNWFIPGEVRFFEYAGEAFDWLREKTD